MVAQQYCVVIGSCRPEQQCTIDYSHEMSGEITSVAVDASVAAVSTYATWESVGLRITTAPTVLIETTFPYDALCASAHQRRYLRP